MKREKNQPRDELDIGTKTRNAPLRSLRYRLTAAAIAQAAERGGKRAASTPN